MEEHQNPKQSSKEDDKNGVESKDLQINKFVVKENSPKETINLMKDQGQDKQNVDSTNLEICDGCKKLEKTDKSAIEDKNDEPKKKYRHAGKGKEEKVQTRPTIKLNGKAGSFKLKEDVGKKVKLIYKI